MSKSKIIVVYQPHQNIRQHFAQIQKGYLHCFDKADKVYWLPTFLSRENDLPILSPQQILVKSGIWAENIIKTNKTDNFEPNNLQELKAKKLQKNETQNLEKSEIQDRLKRNEQKFEISELDQNLAKKLEIHRQNQDLIIFMGAGNIDNWAKLWLKK